MKLSLLRFYCHNIVMSSNPDTMKTRRPSPTPEGEALYEMMVLIPPLYRACGPSTDGEVSFPSGLMSCGDC